MNAAVKSPPTAEKPQTAPQTSGAPGGSGTQAANPQQSLVGNQSVMHSLGASSTQKTDASAAPGRSPDPPIYWGWDTTKEPRLYYATIPPPGRKLVEVAAFLYAKEGAADELRASNPGIGDFLPPGATLHLSASPLAATAQQSLDGALKTGSILRTTGVPVTSAPPPDALVHHLTIGQQTYDLLEPQYQAMLRGLAWHLNIRADYVKGMCEVYLDARNKHVEDSSGFVRGVSDWMGDVSVPDESVYTGPRDRAQAVMDDLAKGEPTTERIADASRRIRAIGEEEQQGERAWHIYIEGTISGAGKTAAGLEVVRNTCFAIEAGLAGAVVAPLAFAAVGGGALGVGAAVGAGAVAGGTLRGGLEVALPGMEADKPASQRFVSGFKSGAIQGGIGAAGALVAPGVAGAIAPRLGIAADVAPTALQRLALGVSTGIVIGAPSGAVASALTNAGSYFDGKMSTLEYLGSIAMGGVGGAAGGAVFGALPIKGLYKSGGQPFNPFSGEPVMPVWMMAGPYSPLQTGWNPPAEFNALAPNELPVIPEGYGWARIEDTWHPISLTGPNRLTLTLEVYGPDANGRMNYNILNSGRLVQSSAVTRPTGATYPPGQRGQMPYDADDFAEPTGQRWIVGHNVDYADTIDTPGSANSNADPLNYTPEPSWWGLHLRRLFVAQVRARGGVYRQMNFYGPTPRTTVSGNQIPAGVYIVEANTAGQAVDAFRVPFTPTGPTQIAQIVQFRIPLNQVPAGLLSPAPSPAISGAGGAAAASTLERKGARQ
jgi:hypothetical protein